MFETLFTRPTALRRHREGPLATERIKYLTDLRERSFLQSSLVHKAADCLRIANELQRWPADQYFNREQLEAFVSRCLEDKAAPSSGRWSAREHIHSAAAGFLDSLGRLTPSPSQLPDRYNDLLFDFITVQREGKWQSTQTCRTATELITNFLEYLQQQDVALEDVEPTILDAYYRLMALRWSRSSLRRSANCLRALFNYCEAKGHTQAGLAKAIFLPRIYRHESIPLGPTWDAVGSMLASSSGDDPTSIRNHAIILLLSVYGMRSGEVRNLRLDDIDWRQNLIWFTRSKSGHQVQAPLQPRVGNAIARYLREVRPKTPSRIVFLRLLAPHRPLSRGGIYNVVKSHLPESERRKQGRGPHGLRHACARHLLESGLSYKQIGDHLGHHDPETTRTYAKVNLPMLRRVSFDDLGGWRESSRSN